MTAGAATHLTYRVFQDGDLPGVLRLWEEDSEWGPLTPEEFRAWYVDVPFEAALITVAVDEEGAIAGQMAFTPCRLVIGQRDVRALRLSAPILRADVRRPTAVDTGHPVIGLYFAVLEEAARGHYSSIFALPERAWIPFFRFMPRFGLPVFKNDELRCRSLPLHASAEKPAQMLTAEPAASSHEELESLWLRARRSLSFRCAVERRADWVRFKNRERLTLDVRDANGELAGYCAFRRDGLLADLLPRSDGDIEQVLEAAIAWLAEHSDETEIREVRAMETPLLLPTLDALSFEIVDFRFGFVATSIDEHLALDELEPTGWWVTAGD